MTAKTPRMADVEHPNRDDMWARHRAAYMDMCPICSVRLERTSRINRLHSALVKFGYPTLTREEVAEAYDLAMTRPTTGDDGVIALLVRSQLVEAGMA